MTKRTMAELNELVRESYERWTKSPDYCGYCKASDGLVEYRFDTRNGTCDVPILVSVHSYVFGPSRQHLFELGDKEMELSYRYWVTTDPITKAYNSFEQWVQEYFQ